MSPMIYLLSDIARLLWYISIAVEAYALISMARKRLVSRYLVFWIMLAISWGISCWLVYEWFSGGRLAYAKALACAQPIKLATICIWALEAYILQARHARKYWVFGSVLAAFFAMMSLLVTFVSAGVGPDGGWSPKFVMLARHFDVLCLTFVSLSAWWFWAIGLRMRRNVVIHTALLLVYLAGNAIGNALAFSTNPYVILLGTFAQLGAGLGAYIGWAFYITPAGEQWEPPAGMTEGERQIRDAGYFTEIRELLRGIRRFWEFAEA